MSAALIGFLGFLLTVLGLTLFLSGGVQPKRWGVDAFYALVFTGGCYYSLGPIQNNTSQGSFQDFSENMDAIHFPRILGFQHNVDSRQPLRVLRGRHDRHVDRCTARTRPGRNNGHPLPLTFAMGPTPAIIMLCGIFYGAQYGGSTTSILVNIPGEVGSIVTCLDGYQMARKGRAGPALGISAMGSFIGGTLSVVGLMLLTPPLAKLAAGFGPPELFALIIFGLMMVSSFGGGSWSRP